MDKCPPNKITHSVVGMEDVRGRRVVDYDDLVQVPAKATEILDIISSVEDAGLPEEAAAEGSPLVQEVRDRVGILHRQYREWRKLTVIFLIYLFIF